jgi:hypothetical protein
MNKEHLIQVSILGLLMILIGWLLVLGIDKTIENQDIMLCESAKISNNQKYLEKCECYYSGEDIKCLQK